MLAPGACTAGQGRVNVGEWLGLHWGHMSPGPRGPPWSPSPGSHPLWHRDPPWRCMGIRSTPSHLPPLGSRWWALALCIVPPAPGLDPRSILPSFAAPPHPSPHLSANAGCPPSPRQRGGTCRGAPVAQGRRGVGAHIPAPVPQGKRSPAERRLLLSKPNFLAGLRESRGAPPPCRAGGKDLSRFFLIGLIYSVVQM